MNLLIKETDQYIVVPFENFSDEGLNNETFLAKTKEIITQNKSLIIEFENNNKIDLATLTTLLSTNKLFTAKKYLLVLSNVSDEIKKLISQNEKASELLIIETTLEAIDYVLMHEIEKIL